MLRTPSRNRMHAFYLGTLPVRCSQQLFAHPGQCLHFGQPFGESLNQEAGLPVVALAAAGAAEGLLNAAAAPGFFMTLLTYVTCSGEAVDTAVYII